MSLYEPKTAEWNEAFHTIPDHSDPSQTQNAKNRQATEVILRLPDLDQIDAEFEEAIDSSEYESKKVDQHTSLKSKKSKKSKKPETGKTSRFDAFAPTKLRSFFSFPQQRPDNERLRKSIHVVVLLLLAGLLGFGVARITDGLGFYGDSASKVTNDCPAPDTPTAPLYKPPQYVSSGKSPAKEVSRLPVDVPSTQLDITTNEPSSESEKAPPAPTGYPLNQSKNTIVRLAPSTVHAWSKDAPQTANSRASIPVGPNLQQNQVFAPSTAHQENHAAPANQPLADRFSPERIQQVLNRQHGTVQTTQYPETRPTPSTVPPVSPYPPTGVYQTPVYRTPAGHTTQTWAAERTSVPPSTSRPYGQPAYPTNGYGYPASSTIAQPPIDPNVYR